MGDRHLPRRCNAPLDGNACFGASLTQLLPVIEINEEFTTFFDDPKRERVTGWQSFIFSAMGIVDFVLGPILIAARGRVTAVSASPGPWNATNDRFWR